MAAFINNECSLRERRIIGQHLDQCPSCEAVYHQQRRTQREMQRDLPRVGVPAQGRLAAIWEQVEQELATPQPPTHVKTSGGATLSISHISWHYALVAVLAVVMLAVPWVMDSSPVHAAVPSQPVPVDVVEAQFGTPWSKSATVDVTEVAYATRTDGAVRPIQSVLHNTPPQTPAPSGAP
jgi:hypothetical protein